MSIPELVLGLDAWLDSMRGPDGYGGPVAHWWRDCIEFTGAGLDWRYEGIICGYLTLHERTGDAGWLEKARRAGDDLVHGQLPDGSYRNSSFEANPSSGGTPHEAACDAGLLRLALTLKNRQDPAWQGYAQAAERNLKLFILGSLWTESPEAPLRNLTSDAAFVPNKAATTIEALLAWGKIGGPPETVERYIRPMLDAILACQFPMGDPLRKGAIRQSTSNSFCFPYYTARCVPALVQGSMLIGDSRYQDAAEAAMEFILRRQGADGGFVQTVTPSGRIVRHPRWVAGVGDILRAMECVGMTEGDSAMRSALEWLLRGAQPNGGIACASGFARRGITRFGISFRPTWPPDWRDLLPVCGWADKAFRYFAGRIPAAGMQPGFTARDTASDCLFRGRAAEYLETADRIEVYRKRSVLYRWCKGSPAPEVAL